ncbi:MAG TPA: PIN/TRAM domain-containing protein [Firmicutes bacterium]|nr:PIN/TRAM domain-containing protein [Bacillota bacterium]
MIKGLLRILITLLGALGGYELVLIGTPLFAEVVHWTPSAAMYASLLVVGGLLGGIIFYIIAPPIVKRTFRFVEWSEGRLQKMPATDVITGAVGLVVGLLIANLLTLPFGRLPVVGPFIPVLANVILGYIGMSLAVKKKDDLWAFVASFPRLAKEKDKDKERDKDKGARAPEPAATPKVLDTSVIIDGRIADIVKSGFLEGTLVIPNFVLEELRHIADSSDLLKRNRGRRGLDILNRIQKELGVKVVVCDRDYEDVAEVDSKLLRLARDLKGKVLTNDYNLNKVAELQGVPVLNINELANAVKPVVLPGEEMLVHVIKDGKEAGQGVAYLDDGTMIVVDGGRRHIGETIGVLVTSVLQTAAGRMIFAKPKAMEKVV